jgi:hypothetical protein
MNYLVLRYSSARAATVRKPKILLKVAGTHVRIRKRNLTSRNIPGYSQRFLVFQIPEYIMLH